MKRFAPILLIALGTLLCGASIAQQRGCELPAIPGVDWPSVSKTTQVTYVYEKDRTAIPRPVANALNKLNAGGTILAADFEVDTTNGSGEIPAQYRVAHDAAVKAGLPCLVVQSGATVRRVVSNPTTLEAVLEASK